MNERPRTGVTEDDEERVGELHLRPDLPEDIETRGGWTPRNLPVAVAALVVMVIAILVILSIAFQLVPR
jgi:hypothetical protein